MNAAVALVESPFQLVSLMEARRCGAVPEDTRVLVRGDAARAESLMRVVDDTCAEPMRRVFAPSPSRALAEARSADRLILGDVLSGLGQLLVVARRGRPVTILDDGASTVHAVGVLGRSSVLARPKESAAARRLPLARAATRELRRLVASGRANWCTGLGGVGATPPIPTTYHSFEWSASVTVPVHLIGRSHVVLGSSLSADGLIDPVRYHDWLERQIRPGHTLFFPHRREVPDTLRFVRTSGAATVTMNGLPVELVVRDLDDSVTFSSLPSTAALTIPRVRRRTELHCESIPDDWWTGAVPPAFRSLSSAICDAVLVDVAEERRRRA